MDQHSNITSSTLLEEYGVHPERGFLPPCDPLRRLPAQFDAWEELGQQLPKILAAGKVHQAITQLPFLDTTLLSGEEELNRAMLLLSYFGHAYVFGDYPPRDVLPANIAVPWYKVARSLGRPPVLSYASHALYNWRRLSSEAPIELGNIARLENFLGGMDEDWFVLIHVAIEAKAGPGLKAVVEAQDATITGDVNTVTVKLEDVAGSLQQMLATLKRMPEKCDPYIYYTRVRPFIFGWKDNPALPRGVIYEGVTEYNGSPQTFRGETGAQSSIIPAIDNALGIHFEDGPLEHHLMALREYMPPLHREFIDFMEKRPSIRDFVLRNHPAYPSLADAYNLCIEILGSFRQKHLEYTSTYIHTQSERFNSNPVEVGTGGTPFMHYLKQHIRELKNHLIN